MEIYQLCLPNAGVTGATEDILYVGAGDLNADPHAYTKVLCPLRHLRSTFIIVAVVILLSIYGN